MIDLKYIMFKTNVRAKQETNLFSYTFYFHFSSNNYVIFISTILKYSNF